VIWRRLERRESRDGNGRGDDRAADQGEPPPRPGLDRRPARRRRSLLGACSLRLISRQDASAAAPDGLPSTARPGGPRAARARVADRRPRRLKRSSQRQFFRKSMTRKMDDTVQQRIRQNISETPVVLFMKGSPVFPQCGFSAAVVQILSHIGVKFKGIDVLSDPGIRQGIKEFSNWPTIPQLYVKGEFVGGCDIIREMFETGELQQLFEQKGVPVRA